MLKYLKQSFLPQFAKRKDRIRSLLLLPVVITALASCGGSDRPNVERVVMFGDSLSDLGTYKKVAEAAGSPTGGKFTVNPGPLWIENVADYYGLTISANRNAGYGFGPFTLGGTGYAEGGSRVSQQPGSFNTDATNGPNSGNSSLPVKDQISTHLSQKGSFKASDLVMVWVGANDVFRPIAFAPLPPDAAVAQLQQAADDLATEIKRLKANGAEKVVVLNIDDWGKAPAFAASAAAQGFASALSSTFNGRLAANLQGVSGVVLVDIYSLFADIRTNPSKYGIINLTTPACAASTRVSSYSLICTQSTLVTPNANNTHLYADTVHYTDRTNRIISDYVIGKIAPIYPK